MSDSIDKIWIATALKALDQLCALFEFMVDEYASQGLTLANNEDLIRNAFLRYILDDRGRHKLQHLTFNAEAQDVGLIDPQPHYTDLKMEPRREGFDDPRRYYVIIECKRLNGQRRLNKEYVDEGIIRFCTDHYISPLGISAMFGFRVSACEEASVRSEVGTILAGIEGRGTEVVQSIAVQDRLWAWRSDHSRAPGTDLRIFHRILACDNVIMPAEKS